MEAKADQTNTNHNEIGQSEIDNFKEALYIDGNDEDKLIRDYLTSAKQYVQNAVSVDADLTKYQQYDFAVQMLAQFWYQNRGIDMKQTPYQVVSMIQQLRGLVDWFKICINLHYLCFYSIIGTGNKIDCDFKTNGCRQLILQRIFADN